jgi:hypothetical protein
MVTTVYDMGVKTGSAPWIYSYNFFTKYFIIVFIRIKDTFTAKVLRSMRPGILFYVTHAATLRGRKVNECGRGKQILQNSKRQTVSILRTHEY